jgi:PAS domain S-box-containing protein
MGAMAQPRAWTELTETLQEVRVPSYIIDRAGIVTWANDAAVEAFGDLVGRSSFSVVVPEHVTIARQQLERKLAGARTTDYEVDVLTADGRRRQAEISSVMIPRGDQAHAVFGVALVGRLREPSPRAPNLTPRQHQVLYLLGEGASTDQIATMLHLSRETVRNHVRSILRALGAHSRLEAVAIAHQEGLLS